MPSVVAMMCSFGVSCRSQIEMGTGRKVVHPVEVLALALAPSRGGSNFDTMGTDRATWELELEDA